MTADRNYLITKIIFFILLGSTLFLLLVLHHCYFRHIGRSPYVAVDDSLANISVTLSNLHRYGFLASPKQGSTVDVRSYAFYNYGPWTFLGGACLDWLFGTSYKIHRYIHLLGILLISLTGIVSFKRYSLAGGCFFVLLLTYVYCVSQWPMVRPDIGVAFFGALAIAFAEAALRTDSDWAWLGLGFAAVSAFTTHQIAWGLVVWAFTIWLMRYWISPHKTDNLNHRYPWFQKLMMLSIGGIIAAFIFLIAIDFRIHALYQLIKAYREAINNTQITYFAILIKHLHVAWGMFSTAQLIILFGAMGTGILLIVLTGLIPMIVPKDILYLLVPSVSMAIAYPLSLMTYNNYHSGYVLLIHVSTLWTCVSTLVAGLMIISKKWPSLQITIERLFSTIVIVLILGYSFFLLIHSTRWNAYAAGKVDFDEYSNEVLNVLPIGASAWGDIRFGLESGTRIQLIQFGEGIFFSQLRNPEKRNDISPDALVENMILQHTLYSKLLIFANPKSRDPGSNFALFQSLFPQEKYRLIHLVNAPPYGTTRVYYRAADISSGEDLPTVAVNINGTRQWARKIGDKMEVPFSDCEPAHFTVYMSNKVVQATATRTIKGNLPEGIYLFSVKVEQQNKQIEGLLLASSNDREEGLVGDLQMPFEIALFFGYEKMVYLLMNHPGGSLYISQLDKSGLSSFQIESVRKIHIFEKPKVKTDLPPLTNWIVNAKEAVLLPIDQGGMHIIGDRSKFGMQISTPPLPVPRRSNIELHLSTYGFTTRAAIGVMDSSGKDWIVYPDSNPEIIKFNTGNHDKITIAVVSDNKKELEKPGEFRVNSRGFILIDTSGQDLYVDRLTDSKFWKKPQY